MKIRILFLTILYFNFHLFVNANVAMPGIWSAGHGSTLIPLFAKDSAAIRSIQMQKEYVIVDLYKSYAVVKGTYWFFNKSPLVQKIRTGYPINGEFSATIQDVVSFTDLLYFRVIIDGKVIPHFNLMDVYDSSQTILAPNQVLNAANNWYVWDMSFIPGGLSKVEVYFIVKTPAVLTQGYGRKEANAFEYILQTGAHWSGNIMRGQILVNLKDSLTVDNIVGILPEQRVFYEKNQLYYYFENLRPSPADDLIIWYQGNNDSISVKMNPDYLYASVNNSDTSIMHRLDLRVIKKNNFDAPTPGWGYFLWGSLLFIVGLFITLLVIIIRIIYRKIKSKI